MKKMPGALSRADRLYVECVFAFYFLVIGPVLAMVWMADLPGTGRGGPGATAEWLCLAASAFLLLGAAMLVFAFWFKHTYLDRCNRCRNPRTGLSRGTPCPECGEGDPGL